MNMLQDIEKLAELKDRGILTEAEFLQKKAEILSSSHSTGLAAPAASESDAAAGSLSTTEKLLIEQRITHEKPSLVLAYVLWFFTNVLGGHRFYLGKTGSAITMLVLSITLFGLIITIPWALIDLFLIPSLARQKIARARYRLSQLPL